MISNRELLLHWWKNYGHRNFTKTELKTFEEIIEKYGEERVLDIIAFSFFEKDDCSPNFLLDTIRKGSEAVQELINSLPKERNEQYQECEKKISELLSETYKKGSS